MKKILSFIMTFILCTLIITPTPAHAAVKINKTKATIYVGYSVNLKITGTKEYVMWKTSDKSVATVSNGKVTGVSEGTAIITAIVGSGSNNKKFSCKVTVKPRLRADITDITMLLDEYQEIEIYFKKPKKGEYLVLITDTDIIVPEWVKDDEKYILRIIPEEIGTASVSIYTATGEDFFSQTINKNEELKINMVNCKIKLNT